MRDLLHDLKFVLRSLRRGGIATWVAIATLTAGLVGATSLFVVIHPILFSDLPADDPERVVMLSRTSSEAHDTRIPLPNFFDWAEQNRSLEVIGGYAPNFAFNTAGTPPERLSAVAVTSRFLSALGVEPLVGRPFDASADQPGAERRVLLSHELWQRRFGGEREVVGAILELDGGPWQIVGVLPPSFHFPRRGVDLWVPLGAALPPSAWNQRSREAVFAVGRLAEGVGVERVRDDLERITEGIGERTGVTPQPQPLVVPLEEKLRGPIREALTLLAVAVFFVLAIACANVAHLLIARGIERRQEIAVRGALGAGRWRIARLMLLESVVLALVATLAALAASGPVSRMIMASVPSEFAVPDAPQWNVEILLFGFLLALATGVLFGLVPAIRFSKVAPALAMRQGQKSVLSGHRTQALLVVAEVAVAVVLLVGAGLVLRSLDGLLELDAGFEPAQLLVLRIDPGPQENLDAWIRFTDEVVRRAESLAEVESAALSIFVPLESDATKLSQARFAKPGQALRPDVLPLGLTMNVTPDYFESLGVRKVAGRLFHGDDDLDRPLVAVVDRGLAETFWPGESPIGRRVAFEFEFPEEGYVQGARVTPIWREVVGVVETVRYAGLRGDAHLQVYAPLAQPPIYFRSGAPPVTLTVKTQGDPLSVSAQLRAALAEIDPTLPIYDLQTMESVVDEHLAEERLLARQLGLFGLLALVLSAAGVYAALDQLVARRTREIGLRQALGASPAVLLRQVARRGLKLSLWGVALGLVASLYFSRLLESRLFGVEPWDPAVFLLAPAILLAVAVAACYVPAWRASKLDPQDCLRYE